ncbi:MAG: hypothetical protein IJI14_14905 [Anaerolineaceae bacterium]|nr:hypothetical protein [Anaerolineaceae bacterium]
MTKALILTADAGFGHRAAANAIADALKRYPDPTIEPTIVNLLDDSSTPQWLRGTQSDFDKIVRDVPGFYEVAYDQSDKAGPTTIAHLGLAAILYNALNKAIKDVQPDVIISTYPLYSGPIQAWYMRNEFLVRTKDGDQYINNNPRKKHIPFIHVITDLYSVHSIWFSYAPDRICVATDKVRMDAIQFGCQPKNVIITGIPVRPEITEIHTEKARLRSLYGLDPSLPLMLAVGSKRVTSMIDYLNVVNHAGYKIQIVMAAGGDDELYRHMKDIEWHVPVKIYNYCNTLPELMLASDMILTKAGGLITSESLAAGLPMLLCDVLPGQEEGNAKVVEEGGAGKLLQSQLDLLETLCHMLMDNGAKLKLMQQKAAQIGKPNAARDISKMAEELIRKAALDAGDLTALVP